MDYCFDSGIPLIAFIGEDEIKNGIVSVKVLNTKEQVQVSRADFVEKVKELVLANPELLPQAKQQAAGKEEAKK